MIKKKKKKIEKRKIQIQLKLKMKKIKMMKLFQEYLLKENVKHAILCALLVPLIVAFVTIVF